MYGSGRSAPSRDHTAALQRSRKESRVAMLIECRKRSTSAALASTLRALAPRRCHFLAPFEFAKCPLTRFTHMVHRTPLTLRHVADFLLMRQWQRHLLR